MAFDLNDFWGKVSPMQGDNAMGWMAGAGDLFKLAGGVNNWVQQANALDQWKQLQSRGPRVNDYYQPMSTAEAAAYTRGVGANAQQNIPPQSQAFNDMLGNAMATRETDRYQQAYRQAFADWQQRMGARGNIWGTDQATSGMNPGSAIGQWLMFRQLMNAQKGVGQPGQSYDPSKVGQQAMPDPYAYGSPEGSFSGQGMPPQTGPSPFGSVQFGNTAETEPVYGSMPGV